MQQYFPCHRCGTHNLVGAVSCRNCHQQLFYNCPHCHAWVDNRYAHCPQCRRALSWPRDVAPQNTYGQTWYVPQQTSYVEEKKGNPLPAILVSLFIIGIIALIFVNPGSSSATKNYTTASTTSTVPVSGAYITAPGSQPQITLSSPAVPSPDSTAPSSTQTAQASSAAYVPSGVTLTTANGEVIEIQMAPCASTSNAYSNASSSSSSAYSNVSSSGSSTVKRSAYLDQLWPTWGHCTKGSCQAYTQQ
jgi:hypothetical protein